MKHTEERWDYWGRFVSRGETNATYVSRFCTASRNETGSIPSLLGGSSVNPLQFFSKPHEGISKEIKKDFLGADSHQELTSFRAGPF
jgi:hypothetical protein